jgi:hypothetical protein
MSDRGFFLFSWLASTTAVAVPQTVAAWSCRAVSMHAFLPSLVMPNRSLSAQPHSQRLQLWMLKLKAMVWLAWLKTVAGTPR